MTSAPADGSLAESLLEPLGFEAFARTYWGRQPLHLGRRGNAAQSGLIGTRDLERILVQTRPAYPDLRIINAKTGPAWEALSSGWLPGAAPGGPEAMAALYQAYADGGSVVLNLEGRWGPVDDLCRSLQARFGRRCSAELYLTPRAAQTFPAHYDLHDVLIVQLDGAKTWHVYDPVVANPSLLHAPDRVGCAVDAASLQSFELTAGDLLYVPAGFAHEVVTAEDRSLHITFGLFDIRVHDVLSEIVTQLGEEDAQFRAGLPLPGAGGGDIAAVLAQAARAMQDPEHVAAAIARIQNRAMSSRREVAAGTFDALDAVDRLGPETPLQRRAHPPCSIEATMGGACLSFAGERMEAPVYALPALDFVARTSTPFTANDLPGGLDQDARLVLLRRLIRLRLLEPVAHVA